MSLEDIRAREQAATEGPWVEYHENGTPGQYEAFNCPPATGAFLVQYGADWNQQSKDAQFIAHARTDIPFLLDERDKLRAALDAVRERLERLEKVAEDHVQSPDQYTSGIGQGLRIAAGSVGLAIDEALR